MSSDHTAQRTITDDEGIKWTVGEAYHVRAVNGETRYPRLSMLWFENAEGRTASALMPEGSLAILTDEDLVELLRVGTGRRGQQP